MTSWTLLIDPLSRLLDKIIPDPEAREKAKLELLKSERENDLRAMELALQADQAQTAINQEEARSADLFISGWRPFIGWVCGVAFGYHFILQPLLIFLMAAGGHNFALPVFDMDTLFTVLMGMLGLGGLRTIEKVKRVI